MTQLDRPELQPLRIPAGWVVEYNDFREIDPSPQAVDQSWLREDLLQVKQPRIGILVDVGWYGVADSGQFVIFVHKGDFRRECLHEFHSRDRLSVVAEVERLLRSGWTQP